MYKSISYIEQIRSYHFRSYTCFLSISFNYDRDECDHNISMYHHISNFMIYDTT